jgi:uncharacterized protein DUF6011
MSNYENAPATILLATHCAACARPLVDAVSVETGMGPDCRKKYMKADVSPENREIANKIVHNIALALSSTSIDGRQVAAQMINTIRELGFAKLADKLTKAHVAVRVEAQGNELIVFTGYDERAVALSQAIPGRIWDKTVKANRFPASQKPAVWVMLKACFLGAPALGPKGYFKIA